MSARGMSAKKKKISTDVNSKKLKLLLSRGKKNPNIPFHNN